MNKKRINEELINLVAKNAKINLNEEETKKFVEKLNEFELLFINLKQIELNKTKPLFQPIKSINKTRKDETKKGLSQEKIFLNTKPFLKENNYFKGPKSI